LDFFYKGTKTEMSRYFSWGNIPVLLVAVGLANTAQAANITIAVASNFTGPIKQIITDFEQQTGNHVRLTLGSSGKIFAQISHGAPFDIFLSADSVKPAALEKRGLTVPGSRFTYAIGTLALWSPRPGVAVKQGAILKSGKFDKLALANPRLAPYGVAAKQVLQSLKLYRALAPKLVMGENIAQTYQFVATGNADIGFVALSQLHHAKGSRWIVPHQLYQPIDQDAVILKAAKNNQAVFAFSRFLRAADARKIILAFGYKIPQ